MSADTNLGKDGSPKLTRRAFLNRGVQVGALGVFALGSGLANIACAPKSPELRRAEAEQFFEGLIGSNPSREFIPSNMTPEQVYGHPLISALSDPEFLANGTAVKELGNNGLAASSEKGFLKVLHQDVSGESTYLMGTRFTKESKVPTTYWYIQNPLTKEGSLVFASHPIYRTNSYVVSQRAVIEAAFSIGQSSPSPLELSLKTLSQPNAVQTLPFRELEPTVKMSEVRDQVRTLLEEKDPGVSVELASTFPRMLERFSRIPAYHCLVFKAAEFQQLRRIGLAVERAFQYSQFMGYEYITLRDLRSGYDNYWEYSDYPPASDRIGANLPVATVLGLAYQYGNMTSPTIYRKYEGFYDKPYLISVEADRLTPRTTKPTSPIWKPSI